MDLLTQALMMGAGGNALKVPLEFVGSSNKQVPDNTIAGPGTTITLSGLQADDVVFLRHTSYDTSAANLNSASADLSSPAWTQVTNASASFPQAGLWYTVATGTSVTVDAEYEPGRDTEAYVLCLYAFRGCNTTHPIVEVGGVGINTNPYGSVLPLTDIDVPPGFDTYAVGFGSLYRKIGVNFLMPQGYTEIFQGQSSGVNNNNATMAIAYTPLSADTAITGKSFRIANTFINDFYNTFQFFLIAAGKDGVPPVITGPSEPADASGGTTVATYTADKAATWSLGGTYASLFSISSGGVVTYNSPSTTGSRDIIIQADNADGIRSYLPVSVKAYSSGGPAGGGITMVTSTSGTTDRDINNPLTLTLSGLQSGDVVFFTYVSDGFNSTFFEGDGSTPSLAGYTQVDTSYAGPNPTNTLFYKAVTSTSESLEFEGQGLSNRSAIGLFAFRGVDNTEPVIDVGAVYVSPTQNTATANIPDHVILDDSVEIVVAGERRMGGATSTPPTGYTEIIDQNVQPTPSPNNAATVHVSSKDVNGGTTESSRVVTFTEMNTTIGYSFTLKPD